MPLFLGFIFERPPGITQTPLRLDSQVKYGALGRGDGIAYLRMPTGVGYREKIWVSIRSSKWVGFPHASSLWIKDHAPGNLIVTEAGGLVTDSRGQSLNFGLGRTLGENYGIIAAGREAHASILEAVQKAQADSTRAKA